MLILLDDKYKRLSYLFLFAEICLFLFLLYLGPLLQIDSDSYIDGYSTRSAIYPLILKSYMLVFGKDFYILIAVQLILGFVAIHYAVHLFSEIFSLNILPKFIIYILFISPYISSMFIGNTILTEAICYPLFIFALSELIKGTMNKNYKNLLMGLLWTALLILTRKQFLFLYSLIGIILIFIFIKYQVFTNKYVVLIVFLSSIITTIMLEKTYHYIYQGTFAEVPFTGFQLINAPLFISQKSDASIFDDPIEKELFIRIRDEIDKRNLSIYHVNKYNEGYYRKFEDAYNTICHVIINSKLTELGIHNAFVIDSILINMSFQLIKANPFKYVKLFIQNIMENMNSYRLFGRLGNIIYILLIILTIFLLRVSGFRLPSIFSLIDYQKPIQWDHVTITSIIILLAHFSNYSLVALVEPILDRYSIYTDVFTASLLCSLLSIALSTLTMKKEIRC